MQLGPLRGYPLLVAKEPNARVEREMDDLAAKELGHQLLPARALRALDDFARQRLIDGKEALRQPEERRPELVLDARAAACMLDVLADERAPLRARLRIDQKHRAHPVERKRGRNVRNAVERVDHFRMYGERVRARERG
jgi:hypothetical protein